ncbi:Haloacid dehydrogenase [Pandoravirus macleodensis]|uniref:Haloacid dehydrogenase n=1 Tax=Pandoravirus macleodensis TaxID=2107707 RepID=A0A2U7UEC9_9VIRU|nr:Haloacid dehydrogenase [Pandoravirus macleodensis]AVK76794.1 Haloacid dehydrogenase [Pandoravirus macleodensis]UMO79361.1 Haloacid dehydrogenase [Pandoravirus aubagnensis]
MYAPQTRPRGNALGTTTRGRRLSLDAMPLPRAHPAAERAPSMFDARPRARRGSLGSPSWAPASPSWPHVAAPMGLAAPVAHDATRSQDPAAIKAAVDAYMTSPAYEQFVEALCRDALRAVTDLMHRLGPEQRRRAAAFFDVDDTLLSSHPDRRHRFATWLLSTGQRMPSAYLPPLPPVVNLYNTLRSMGVRTVILTGRRSTNEAVTLNNLRWAGVDGWDHAIFRAVGTPEQHIDAVEYKSRQRARLVAAGYVPVANIGDQHSDLNGGNSGVAVKLPNPMHTIP